MASIEFESVTKRFGPTPAVDQLDLPVRDGELLVLLGPSGCGKTTTLRLIAGLESPTAGQIRIGGRVVNRVPPKDRDVAMVFQNPALYPHLSVFDNLAFGPRMRGLPPADVATRVHDAAQRLGIEALLPRKPTQLSGGERQRVAIGKAIVRRPAVFLFDEPLGNLDARLRESLRGEILRLHRQLGTTLIFVTHDQDEAMQLGDRIVVLDRGRLQQVGTPRDVLASPANPFVAEFLGVT